MLAFFFYNPLWFDPYFMGATVLGLLMTLWAQFRVKSAFHRYAKVGLRSGMSGAEAAAAVARAGGADVKIERHGGFLTDHYDPRSKTLRLSPDVYDGRSISSVAVGAHEAGHAIQDVAEYAPLGFRTKMVPVANVGAHLWYFVFLIGIMLNYGQSMMGPLFMNLGILLFGLMVAFQLVTLPVEFDASKRAKAVLASSGIVSTAEEAQGVEKVLGAAAMTYVAAAAASVLQLLAMILRAQQRN